MADDPNPTPPVIPSFSTSGSVHAPFLYFENASAFGVLNGIVQITLEARRLFPSETGEKLVVDRVAVAHLRMNIQAALSLKAAIESALLLASPTPTGTKN